MNLDYFIATLPTPTLDAPGAPDMAAFRAACEAQLDDRLAAAVGALLDDTPSEHAFVRAWRDRDTILRNAVARRRAGRQGGDGESAQRPTAGSDLRIEHAVAAAFEQPDPLRRERALDQLRWHVLDELQGNQPLAAAVVLAYAVRLRLAARWAARSGEAGRARLEALATLPADLLRTE